MTPEEQGELERLRKENDILRGIVAYSELPCVHCRLSKDDMSRCQFGFPGCARADDMLCADMTELGWMFPEER
jgi:hypothetical protein